MSTFIKLLREIKILADVPLAISTGPYIYIDLGVSYFFNGGNHTTEEIICQITPTFHLHTSNIMLSCTH